MNEGEDRWTIPGDVHLDEVERLIGHDLPRDDSETIAGLIINAHGDLPPEGAVVRVDLPEKASETVPVSYTHLRAHETVLELVCRLLLDNNKDNQTSTNTSTNYLKHLECLTYNYRYNYVWRGHELLILTTSMTYKSIQNNISMYDVVQFQNTH